MKSMKSWGIYTVLMGSFILGGVEFSSAPKDLESYFRSPAAIRKAGRNVEFSRDLVIKIAERERINRGTIAGEKPKLSVKEKEFIKRLETKLNVKKSQIKDFIFSKSENKKELELFSELIELTLNESQPSNTRESAGLAAGIIIKTIESPSLVVSSKKLYECIERLETSELTIFKKEMVEVVKKMEDSNLSFDKAFELINKDRAILLSAISYNAYKANAKIMELPEIGNSKSIEIIESSKESLRLELKKHGIEKEVSTYFEAIEALYLKLKEEANNDLGSGEKMAELASIIRDAMKESSLEDKRNVYGILAQAVMRLESYSASEYIATGAEHILTSNLSEYILQTNDIKSFTSEYANNTEVYRKYSEEANGGVLSFEEYRNIVAQNKWPLFVLPHDMIHVHHGVKHPEAFAAVFASGRSKNHTRHFLLASLFEAVDTFQFSHETALARHYNNKGYKLSEALLEIGSMTKKELKELIDEVGIKEAVEEGIEEIKDFRPVQIEGTEFSGLGIDGRKLEHEINFMISELSKIKETDTDVNMENVLSKTDEINHY